MLKVGCANMNPLEPELLDAMKDCLRDLENVKTVSPDTDYEIEAA